MLRPNKDEGERSGHKQLNSVIRKAPLIFTTALIFAYPVCLAEQALGSTSSFGKSQAQYLQQTVLGTHSQIQPKSYPGLRLLSSSSLPSESQIQSLESILSRYKTNFVTLEEKAAARPDLASQLEPLIAGLKTEISNLSDDIAASKTLLALYNKHKATLTSAVDAYNNAVLAETQASLTLDDANAVFASKKEIATAAAETLAQATTTLETATTNLTEAASALVNATAAKDNAAEELRLLTNSNVSEEYEIAVATYNQALAQKNQAQATYSTLSQQLMQATATRNQAQSDYDTNLIPDPAWIHPTYQQEHTRQVPVTTTTMSGGLTAKVYDRNGYNNAPPMPYAGETPIHTTTVPNIDYNWNSGQVLNSNRNEDVIVEFKGLISPATSGYYRFYTPADDGTRLYINNQLLIDDWYDKGGGGSVSDPIYLEAGTTTPITLYYYENGGGAAVSFYYYTSTDGYRIVPAAWLGTQTQTTTTYITETYYTTELVPNQSAPLIKNPAKLQTLNEAQAVVDSLNPQVLIAGQALAVANTDLDAATINKASAQSQLSTHESAVSSAETSLTSATAVLEQATEAEAEASTTKASALAAYNTAKDTSTTANAEFVTAEDSVAASTASLTSAKTTRTQALEEKTAAEETVSTTETKYSITLTRAMTTSAKIDFKSTEEVLATPEPKPEEPGSPDLPEEISAASLMTIDLEQVDPTEMSVEQAEQLKKAALETFETAEPGSDEYLQALDALFLAAEQDDIELSPELAAIPGLLAATEIINFLGNAGADMSPKVREESKKIVVAAVVAAGTAIQAAAGAAASSASMSRRN